MDNQLVVVLDFGGQYNQLIARRVRDLNVYCEVLHFDTPIDEIKAKNPIGIIFTGGPSVVTEEGAPIVSTEIFDLGIPVLGICYGCQLMGHLNGGKVVQAPKREYGKTNITYLDSVLFDGVVGESTCFMSHTYHIDTMPDTFKIISSTETCHIAAMENVEKQLYGVQFHPEVVHTPDGNKILHNFLYKICNAKGDWNMKDVAANLVASVKEKVGNRRVLCALSGGVDSSVVAVIVHKAIGDNLTCVFVDHGLLRHNEGDEVEDIFTKRFSMNLIRVDAKDRFLGKLKDISDPETKRKIIGEEFIRVFEDESKKLGSFDFLAQGTIYPDVIESGTKTSAVIKSHHNVGGLPDVIDFDEILEPLRDLFKDEVRRVGLELDIPEDLVFRQPFPGPGLAIRIIGDVTEEKLEILRHTDHIYREEIKNAGLDREIWQYFTVLTGLRSVGVMGDERTYGYTIALRGVTSLDAMSADFARIPYDVLEKISVRLVNEVKEVNRVVYDITSKPPSTIEWE